MEGEESFCKLLGKGGLARGVTVIRFCSSKQILTFVLDEISTGPFLVTVM